MITSPSALIVLGVKLAVAPLGKPVADKFTVSLNPFTKSKFKVYLVVLLPLLQTVCFEVLLFTKNVGRLALMVNFEVFTL